MNPIFGTPEWYEREMERTFLKNGTQMPPIWGPALGIAGESGELDEALEHQGDDEVIKEMGDVLWYIFAAFKTCGLTLDQLLDDACRTYVREGYLQHWAARYSDQIKKVAWHGKELNKEEALKNLGNCLAALYDCAHTNSMNLWQEVAPANIAKLKKRYPDKFVEGGGVR